MARKKKDVNPLTGQRIRKHRLDAGLSQEELASEVGSTKDTISRIERGLNEPENKLIVSLVKNLGITTDYLLVMTDDPHGYVTSSDLSEDEQLLIRAWRKNKPLVNEIIAKAALLNEEI